ncbi:MAG: ComEA family DNA-binding protein [Planctomycetota bacterium]|jgi:DNA uptake protein ComE-like DNA-binding protein
MSLFEQNTTDLKSRITQSFALVIAAVLAVMISGGLFLLYLPRPELSNRIVLQDWINPNDAPVQSLIRLPGIGPARANAIIAYRRGFKDSHPNTSPFLQSNDLQKIKGIGPKTVENIEPFIKFQTSMP